MNAPNENALTVAAVQGVEANHQNASNADVNTAQKIGNRIADSDVLSAALEYAAKGWKTFPCRKGLKVPATARGFHDATADVDTIRRVFANSGANVAIATGIVSGIVVIDEDTYKGGDLSSLESDLGFLPPTLEAKTRAGGRHLYYRYPVGLDLSSSNGQIAPSVDLKANGGYVVAAPSYVGADEKWPAGFYHWANHLPVADLPSAWAEKWASLRRSPKTQSQDRQVGKDSTPSRYIKPESVKEGQRNSELLKYCCHLRGRKTPESLIPELAAEFNLARCIPPLDDEEVIRVSGQYANQGEAGQSEWLDPQELSESLPPVPPFPIKLLPGQIGAYALDVAERMNCPVDFPAIAAMVALGTAIGSRICCKPEAVGIWMVPAGAWGMVVSPPGATKSPPLSEMLGPLYKLDKQAADQHSKDMEKYVIQKAIYDRAVKVAIGNGTANVGVSPPTEPNMVRYVVNDSTYEMLIAIAKANPAGFLVWRDELVGWFHSLNKENQKEARGLYLTGWSGTEGYATDRIGRGHVRADCVNLSLLGTIQPNVLRQIVYDAVAGGGSDDGLVARFQLAVYPNPVRHFVKVGRHPDYQAMNHYKDLIQRLVKLDPTSIGAATTADGVAYLTFSDEAQVIFDDWQQPFEDRIRNPDSDEHPAMLAHLGKYRSLFPKLALILHLADGGTGPIGGGAAARAMIWLKYLEAHARRIYHTATNRVMQSAVALANKIKAGKLPDQFTRSDVLTKEWSGLRTADEVATALTVLRDMSWLSVKEDRSTGGRPAERYTINPKVKRAA